jgi:hypothetical protein
LHTWHHLSWLLFGFYPCEVLELVVILMTSSNSSKTDSYGELVVFFMVREFTGSSYREVSYLKRLHTWPHLSFCWVLFFILFPTKLVSPHLEFPCKSCCCFSAYPVVPPVGSVLPFLMFSPLLRVLYYCWVVPGHYRQGWICSHYSCFSKR